MKEAIRCCISCILPCGALDVVRIVHASGRVQEIAGNAVVFAGDIMEAHPDHVLRKPPSPAISLPDYGRSSAAAPRRAVTLPPTAELRRGKIYFLVPAEKTQAPAPGRRRKRRERGEAGRGGWEKLAVSSDRYLAEIMSEKAVAGRERRRGRVAVWRPGLESISEQSTSL